MKNIRNSVFETNSSSCHAITFSQENSIDTSSLPQVLQLKGGSWGWDFETYKDPQSKFSYWFNAFIQHIIDLVRAVDMEKKGEIGYNYNHTINPIDKNVYINVADQTIKTLQTVITAFQEKGVSISFTCREGFRVEEDGIQVYEESAFTDMQKYVKWFKKVNMQPSEKALKHPMFDYIVSTGCGIDHQSAPNEDEDCKRLATLSPEKVVLWVLGDGWFKTGNDN